VEGAAARAAAERRTDLDLMKLEQVHAAMLADSPADPERLVTTNRKFHETIWAMSHNATLVDLLGRLHAHLIRYRETTLTYPDRWDTVLKEHQQLIEAIQAGDRERAGQIAEQHMTGARNVRLQMYAEAEAAR
jgi:DNA-binding FadR family transcriptional regulator